MFFSEFKTKKASFRKRLEVALFFVVSLFVSFGASASLWAEEVAQTVAEPKLDPLAWKGDLALWTAVVFLILLLVLCKFAFGPIVKALDQREKNELDRVEAAERANADAKALLDAYQHKWADSEDEVRQIVADARQNASQQAKAIVEDAKQAAANERERALRDIQAASDAALQDIAVKSAELATSLAGKILKEEIDSAAHEKLIEDAVGKMTSK